MSVANEPAHSPYGPSSAERWLACPASVRATKGLPDTDSDWSTEGTAAHTLSEWCRLEDRAASYWANSEVQVEQVDGTFVEVDVDSEMVTHVQEFVDYVQSFNGDHLVEVRVYYEQYVPFGFGTLDHATLSPGLARITDLKYGKGVKVSAKENEQLMCYALGIWLEWDWAYGFDKFILTIHQPRLDNVDTWEVSLADLLAWATETLVNGYKATLDPNAKFNPGSWCQFCKIKATCRARAAKTFEVLHGEFDNLNEFAPPQPAELSNDELAAARNHFPTIKSWMAAVDEKIYAELGRGHSCGDLKLVSGRSARIWLGDEKSVANALAKAGLTKEQIFEPASIRSPPALEKLVKGLAPRFKKTGKKGPGDLADLVNILPGKPTIVAGDDERESLSLKADNEFSKLED